MGIPTHKSPHSLDSRAGLAVAIVPVLAFLAIYAPAAGHGFVRDDYSWILQSRVACFADLLRVLLSLK